MLTRYICKLDVAQRKGWLSNLTHQWGVLGQKELLMLHKSVIRKWLEKIKVVLYSCLLLGHTLALEKEGWCHGNGVHSAQPHQPTLSPSWELYMQLCTFGNTINVEKANWKATATWMNVPYLVSGIELRRSPHLNPHNRFMLWWYTMLVGNRELSKQLEGAKLGFGQFSLTLW